MAKGDTCEGRSGDDIENIFPDDFTDSSSDELQDDFIEEDDDDLQVDASQNDVITLCSFCFVSVNTDSSGFEMHALVQLATRIWLVASGKLEQ